MHLSGLCPLQNLQQRRRLLLKTLVNSNHHARSLDDGIGLAADLEAEVLGGGRGDRRNDLFAGGGFNRDFSRHRAFVNFNNLADERIACGNLYFYSPKQT